MSEPSADYAAPSEPVGDDALASASYLPGFEPVVRSTDDMLGEAREIVRKATADHKPSRRFILFSGGNDSLVTLDALAPMADEIVHINTTIGIPETGAFARRVAKRYDLAFSEWEPPKPYGYYVLRPPFKKRDGTWTRGWDGLPRPFGRSR